MFEILYSSDVVRSHPPQTFYGSAGFVTVDNGHLLWGEVGLDWGRTRRPFKERQLDYSVCLYVFIFLHQECNHVPLVKTGKKKKNQTLNLVVTEGMKRKEQAER